MKEAALSAAALMGLMGFAAYYNSAGEPSRTKRSLDVQTMDAPDPISPFNDTQIEDGAQPSEEQLLQLLEELNWMGTDLQTGDDVKQYAIPRINFKKITRNKFGNADWNAAFKLAHRNRLNALTNWLEFNDFRAAVPNSVMTPDEEGNLGQVDEFYGYDKTHPKVAQMLAETSVQTMIEQQTHFAQGANVVLFIQPTEVPLNSGINANVKDYTHYWQFLFKLKPLFDKYSGRLTSSRTPKLMIGRQSSKRIAWLSKSAQKYNRKRYPWNRVVGATSKPSLSALQPFESQHVQAIGDKITITGGSSPSADSDCWVFKFHQDVPQDSNQFLLPETQANALEVRSKCTFLDIFVGYPAYDPAIMSLWSVYDPSLQTVAPLDVDYSGKWIVPDHKSLIDPAFQNSVLGYMALAKARSLCRCSEEAYEVPVTVAPATASSGDVTAAAAVTAGPLDGEREATEAPLDEVTTGSPHTEVAEAEVEEATEAPTVAGVVEAVTGDARESVIDSCCGIGLDAHAYDSELSTCCEDGSIGRWGDDGSDPCEFAF